MHRTLQILIVLIVIDLIGGGVLWFGYNNMDSKKTEKIEIQKELAIENQKGEKLQASRRTLSLIKEERVVLGKFLFDQNEENQIHFLSILEGLGVNTTGASVVTNVFTLSQVAPKSVHTEISIEGTWSELYHLLRLVETLPTHIVINRFTVSRVGTTGDGNPQKSTWRGNLAFDIMSVKEEEQK